MKKSLLILSTLAFASSNLLGYSITVQNDSGQDVYVKTDKQLKAADQSFKNKNSKIIEGYVFIEKGQKEIIKTDSGKRAAAWKFTDKDSKTGKTFERGYTTQKEYTNPDQLTISGDIGGYTMIEKISGIQTGKDVYVATSQKTQKKSEELQAEAKEADIQNKIKEAAKFIKIDAIEAEINRVKKSGDNRILEALLKQLEKLYTNKSKELTYDELVTMAKEVKATIEKEKTQRIKDQYTSISQIIEKAKEAALLKPKAPTKTFKCPTEKEIDSIKGKNTKETKEKLQKELDKVDEHIKNIKEKNPGKDDKYLSGIYKKDGKDAWTPIIKIQKYIDTKIKKIDADEKKKEEAAEKKK